MSRRAWTPLLALLAACVVTPLTNKINVGEDPFVIGVGEGPDSLTDLFAVPAGGGAFVRLTFNRAEEQSPKLSPDGLVVAYLRHSKGGTDWSLVLLDLVRNTEHSAAIPATAGVPVGLGWSPAGDRLVVQAGRYLTTRAPGPILLEPIDSVPGDSLVRERLGPDRQGVIRACPGGRGLCVVVGDAVTPLGAERTGVIRWGADSLGYFEGETFEVRPLAAGYARKPAWTGLPSHLRELTYHEGQVTTRTGVSGRR